jgi:hypothetical protein
MEDGNIGLLLHKLTKYQTLQAHNDVSEKASLYEQKINYYKSKLEDLGIDKDNLNNLGGVISGGAESAELLEKLVNEQVEKVKEALKAKASPEGEENNGPTLQEVQESVNKVSLDIDMAKTKYNSSIENLVLLIKKLLSELDNLEQSVPNVAGNIDLSTLKKSIDDVKGKLEGMLEENIINSTYAKLIIEDNNLNTAEPINQEINQFSTLFEGDDKKEQMIKLFELMPDGDKKTLIMNAINAL